MKRNYLIISLIIVSIILKPSILNLVNNLTKNLFIKNESIELNILKSRNDILKKEYEALLTFKNNININTEYSISNVIKNNYGFGNLIIPGNNYEIGDEVINEEGLVGIIIKINYKNSEIEKVYDTNIIVKINNETGKISSKDSNNNLVIKEVSNYNNIKINDSVYSLSGHYIGKVIKIKYGIIDNYLTVKTIDLNNLNYVAVLSISDLYDY